LQAKRNFIFSTNNRVYKEFPSKKKLMDSYCCSLVSLVRTDLLSLRRWGILTLWITISRSFLQKFGKR
jgi:hypothetical protein